LPLLGFFAGNARVNLVAANPKRACKAKVGKRIFVRAKQLRLRRQRCKAAERLPHLLRRSFKKPPASGGEKRIAAEKRIADAIGKVPARVARGIDHLDRNAAEGQTIARRKPLGSSRDRLAFRCGDLRPFCGQRPIAGRVVPVMVRVEHEFGGNFEPATGLQRGIGIGRIDHDRIAPVVRHEQMDIVVAQCRNENDLSQRCLHAHHEQNSNTNPIGAAALSQDGSIRPVLAAVFGNATVTIAKFIAFALSGSSAMLAEALHSLADTMNQALLWVGLVRSKKGADREHQFGYGQERYFWNLVSAITIFFLGGGYTILHAIEQLQAGAKPEAHWTTLFVLALAFVVESFTLWLALREFNRQRKKAGRTFRQWLTETRDPTTLAVLVEDSVAVLGLVIAALGIGIARSFELPAFDAAAAIVIGVLMGALAIFLAAINRSYLLNRSDPELDQLVLKRWCSDKRVQSVPRVNTIVLSPEATILMAEVELREEEMFEHMSPSEIDQVRRFMRKVDAIRRDLEAEVRRAAPRAQAIFIEFTLPGEKDASSE